MRLSILLPILFASAPALAQEEGGGPSFYLSTDRVFAPVAGEVAVVAVDHGTPGPGTCGEAPNGIP